MDRGVLVCKNVPNVNILHITCRMRWTVLQCQKAFPNVNFGREMTAGHLLLNYDMNNDGPCWMKVNPPIRSKEDVEYLWGAVAKGEIDWIVTDHASAPTDFKVNPEDPSNIWDAKAGFGGVEYLLAGLYSEGVVNEGFYHRAMWRGSLQKIQQSDLVWLHEREKSLLAMMPT